MGSDREQELARTATAAASGAEQPAEPAGGTLGRYRLERELGAGAMGVVHAAFDPDLERRIALTVCAVGISDDLLDPESRRRFYTHLAEFDVKCEHIGPTTELVTLATPPQQRYD